jgi:hypothetical protein
MQEKAKESRNKQVRLPKVEVLVTREGNITIFGRTDESNPVDIVRLLKEKGLVFEKLFHSPCG